MVSTNDSGHFARYRRHHPDATGKFYKAAEAKRLPQIGARSRKCLIFLAPHFARFPHLALTPQRAPIPVHFGPARPRRTTCAPHFGVDRPVVGACLAAVGAAMGKEGGKAKEDRDAP
mgnify:CR=1 FL=1